MHDFIGSTWFSLLLEKLGPGLLSMFARKVSVMMRATIFRTVFCLTASWIMGATVGWYAHGASIGTGESQKPCREEVISVDGARGGPVSCTHAEHTGELKDGYLVCKCKKK
jgi:hypothetical protein